MKDFCKWLGVNEKVAKIVVWILIIMCMLIIFNSAFESLGFPYYKITVDNISKINYSTISKIFIDCVLTMLNFYAITFLIFKINNFSQITKYGVLYIFLNTIFSNIFNFALMQIFIILYVLIFSYLYSGKNWKYIIYALGSIITNVLIQYICFNYKLRFLESSNITEINQLLTSIDYFVIVAIIVLLKEIIMKKKRGVEK